MKKKCSNQIHKKKPLSYWFQYKMKFRIYKCNSFSQTNNTGNIGIFKI